MQRRYQKNKVKKYELLDSEKTKSMRTLPIYGDIPRHENDLYILSVDGDRLDLISNRFYGTPKYWWVIALANNMGKGTLFVTPGAQLRIPHAPSEWYEKIR